LPEANKRKVIGDKIMKHRTYTDFSRKHRRSAFADEFFPLWVKSQQPAARDFSKEKRSKRTPDWVKRRRNLTKFTRASIRRKAISIDNKDLDRLKNLASRFCG
jgi:hypothetical protein